MKKTAYGIALYALVSAINILKKYAETGVDSLFCSKKLSKRKYNTNSLSKNVLNFTLFLAISTNYNYCMYTCCITIELAFLL